MTMTAAAHALKGREVFLSGSISSLLAGCDGVHDADAKPRALLLSTFGRVWALRLARSQDEFEAAFELLATRRFALEFNRLFTDQRVLRLVREARACELAGHGPMVVDHHAEELADDLAERYALLASLLAELKPSGRPPHAVLDAYAGWIVAAAATKLASFAPDQWSDWMVGMLWNFGRRALVDIAKTAGASWGVAVERLTTKRDLRLLEKPFDQATSDEAARLLGIQ